MTKEELEAKVKELCPEMLTHGNFMHAADCVFCKEIPNDSHKALSDDEFEAWHKLSEKLQTATVAQVIEYLQKNFKLDDKLCYMDCVEGVRNDCTYITRDQLGKRFFYTVRTMKEREKSRYPSETGETLKNQYPYVEDDDVIVG